MPDWLHQAFPKDGRLDVGLLAFRLAVALMLGCVVAGIYHLTRGKGNGSTGLLATLVLLTVLIVMVTLAIGDSIPRAFSLVGALSIVRFRTVVEDTRDTAFVIFAVAVGMAVGAGYLTIPLVGIPFAALAAYLFRSRGGAARTGSLEFTLTVRVGVGHHPNELLRDPLSKHLARSRVVASATARQGAALELTYAVVLR